MKEIIIKNKILIFRVLGGLMLFISFIVYFWVTPDEVLSENEIAAANIARIEASALGSGKTSSKASSKPETSPFMEEFKNAQKKQLEYLIIVSMLMGIGFLGYSFINRSKNDSEQ
ncbi:MAG: hypothetical protein A2513_06100 [Sulfurimonas sp. RIFOXYD12_FULL_33_39]|uniref:hypothetical protein n=1 Tax=unclassified Sulfurimonas TaxID=2623549 RepID=UPI0008BEB989|nr:MULTISPECIES: hypothetical protein [unclassified Sulfurimonas]OHE06693.1 MAG: hypothetical protein A3G74_04625 [Sulfurimonas sp. RIFCSPLOWO2_12_FULL_34_6]OHE10429.1 MAG: hypothetical protein A2513_06100 [Sulfurimonas sp. RIFOXYD12_FULL_33_39]OHE14887.1 MAG: hypothetical protein A2530_00290 [Sulfurimonas sp. RIFOXYD2_FULL_34_21]